MGSLITVKISRKKPLQLIHAYTSRKLKKTKKENTRQKFIFSVEIKIILGCDTSAVDKAMTFGFSLKMPKFDEIDIQLCRTKERFYIDTVLKSVTQQISFSHLNGEPS